MSNTQRAHRLVTLAFSHYNEKARWALDYAGIEYEERAYMPLFSQLGVMLETRGRGGRADAVSSRWSTPILITRDGETLTDSTAIARWASARCQSAADPLFSMPEVSELVDSFGRQIGPYTRLVGYYHLLGNKKAMRTLADGNVSPSQAFLYRALAPIGAAIISRALGVTRERRERAVARVKREIAKVEERLSRGPYLVGDAFTAADLTFSSLMAPALCVTREEGYGATLPTLSDLDPEARDLIEEMRATRAGVFALEMFRRHRHARAPSTSLS